MGMNNQAAQTMPLPPSLPEWSRMDDLGGVVPSEVRQALIAMYQQGYAAALSQTAGVAHLMTGVPDKDGREICAGDRIVYRNASQYTNEEYWNPEYIVEWKAPAFVLRHVGGGKDDSNASFAFNVAVRDPYWAIKLETIAAAPAASGGECPAGVECARTNPELHRCKREAEAQFPGPPDDYADFLDWAADELVKRGDSQFVDGVASSMKGRAIVIRHVRANRGDA